MSRSACSSCSLFYSAARRRRRCALGLGRAGVLIAPTPSPPPPPPTSRSSVASMTSPPGDPAGLSSDDGFPHSADGYELLQPIGRGATAICFRAICKSNQQEVAIKIIDLENCPAEIEDIRREIVQMRRCSHPNVVKSYCSFVHGPYLWLVMDFHSGGSVLDVMKYKFQNGLNDEALIATVLKDALHGIEYLHSTGQLHRDVKGGNLLISRDGRILLGDFGVSALLMESGAKRKSTSFVGTPCWMAPEVMEQVRGYDFKADIWSFGITALEVLLMTLQNPPPALEGNAFSKAFKDLVEQCLQKDPMKRPTAAKLLEHKFFKLGKKREYVVKELLAKLPPLWERLQVTSTEDLEKCKEAILNLDKPADNDAWSFGETLRQKLDMAALKAEAEKLEPSSTSGGGEASAPISIPSTGEGGAEPVSKGRFTVTQSSSQAGSNVETKGRFQISKPSSSAIVNEKAVAADPLTDVLRLMGQLNVAVKRLQEENERLKQENRELRKSAGDGTG